MNIYKILIARLFILFFLLAPPAIAKPQPVTKAEIDSAVHKMARLIEANYVFAEKGKNIAGHLLEEHRRGSFRNTGNWTDFAKSVTQTLRNYSHDGHLYARRDSAIVKELVSYSAEETTKDNTESEKRSREKNYGFKEVKILAGNVGYIKLTEIDLSTESICRLFACMQFIADTRGLIIDLQDNGGGGSTVGPVFESLFLPGNTTLLEFRTRSGNSSVGTTLSWLPVKRYENPLYILVNKGTASAAEYLSFALQLRGRAKIVGQKSAGAAHMNSWYPVNEQIFLSVSTASPTIPGTDESWEQKGVQPDYPVEPGKEIDFILSLHR